MLVALMRLMVEQDAEAVRRSGQSTEQQLASLLLEMQGRAEGSEGIEVGHADLAVMVGTTTQNVVFTLGRLQRSGVLEHRAGRVMVLNQERLRRLAYY